MITVGNITCDCTEPGYCPHFNKKTDLESHKRIWEILQGINITDVNRTAYLNKWANEVTKGGDVAQQLPQTFRVDPPATKTGGCNCGAKERRKIR